MFVDKEVSSGETGDQGSQDEQEPSTSSQDKTQDQGKICNLAKIKSEQNSTLLK